MTIRRETTLVGSAEGASDFVKLSGKRVLIGLGSGSNDQLFSYLFSRTNTTETKEWTFLASVFLYPKPCSNSCTK